MANTMMAHTALLDEATITTGNELTALPATNLQTLQPSTKWRTSGLSDIYVEVDLGSANSINLIALIGHNGSSSATWQIRGATSQANLTSSPGYDSGSVSMFATTKPTGWDELPSLRAPSAAQNFQWWRVDVTDGSNGDGFFQAGRLVIDAAWQPSDGNNLEYDWGLSWLDRSPIDTAIGGQTYPTGRSRRRRVAFSLNVNDEDEMFNNAFEIDRTRGRQKDVLWVFDPDDTTHLHRRMVYGLIGELAPIVNPAFGLFTKQYLIEELL